jgi:hypothetical protein
MTTGPTTEAEPVAPPEVEAAREPAPVATGVALTVAAWAVTRLVVGSLSHWARDPFRVDPTIWDRWDSGNYLFIAQHGRDLGRCGSRGFPTLFPQLKGTWCGHAGWLPGYPWLIEAVHWTGIARPSAGLLVSWVALAVALALVWFGWLRELGAARALAVLLLVGLFPGAVYNLAVFPTSVALALVVGALVAATRGRFLTGALLMVGAGLCYPSAWFAAAGMAVALVVVAIPSGPGATARRALWGAAGLGSLLLLGLHDQLVLGHADAYLLVQRGTGLHPTPFPGQIFLPRAGRDALVFQCVLAIALVATTTVVAALTWRRRSSGAAELYPALAAAGVVLGLLVLADSHAGAWNRSVVLAAPCMVVLRRAPQWVLWPVVAVVAVTTALVSRFFFSIQLI